MEQQLCHQPNSIRSSFDPMSAADTWSSSIKRFKSTRRTDSPQRIGSPTTDSPIESASNSDSIQAQIHGTSDSSTPIVTNHSHQHNLHHRRHHHPFLQSQSCNSDASNGSRSSPIGQLPQITSDLLHNSKSSSTLIVSTSNLLGCDLNSEVELESKRNAIDSLVSRQSTNESLAAARLSQQPEMTQLANMAASTSQADRMTAEANDKLLLEPTKARSSSADANAHNLRQLEADKQKLYTHPLFPVLSQYYLLSLFF
jgi:hypothetical protein